MDSDKKEGPEIEIRLLSREEFKVVSDNCIKLGWAVTLEPMHLMYDALSNKGYKMFGAVNKNGKILSKYIKCSERPNRQL